MYRHRNRRDDKNKQLNGLWLIVPQFDPDLHWSKDPKSRNPIGCLSREPIVILTSWLARVFPELSASINTEFMGYVTPNSSIATVCLVGSFLTEPELNRTFYNPVSMVFINCTFTTTFVSHEYQTQSFFIRYFYPFHCGLHWITAKAKGKDKDHIEPSNTQSLATHNTVVHLRTVLFYIIPQGGAWSTHLG